MASGTITIDAAAGSIVIEQPSPTLTFELGGPPGPPGEVAGSVDWANVTGKPSTFTPSAHASSHASTGSDAITIAQSQVTSLVTDLAAKASKSANLSDLASASSARTNLGLGGAAVLNVGTTAGTVSAGDDSRITGAAQKASNLSDLASASTARTNLGLGTSATLNVPAAGDAASGEVVKGNDSRLSDARTPTSHTHPLSQLTQSSATSGQVATWNGTAWAPATPTTGTVTSVSVTTSNGVSGTVATATSTPAITLSLGAITPTSVAASGTVTGSNLSGNNTGDQTITLTGDVTGTGTGSFVTTLANSGASAGTYGSATAIPALTIDAKGRVTGATTFALSTLPDQTGNSGKYLTTNGTAASWATVSVAGSALTGSSLASGITSSSLTSFGNNPTLAGSVTFDGFVVDTSTYSSQTFARITATNAATNVSVVLKPKGTGYLSCYTPDGTLTGGNVRGTNAVDLVPFRGGSSTAAEVASGNYSVLIGGQYSRAAADYAVTLSGYNNANTGSNSAAIAGTNLTVSGTYAGCVGGYINTVSGNYAFTGGGYQNTISGLVAAGFGEGLTVSGRVGFATGAYAVADKRGQCSHAAYTFAANGDAQRSHLVARVATTNATPTNMWLDGSSERITIPANTTWEFEVHIVARTASATGTYAKFVRSGVLSRNSTAASTAIATVDTVGTDRGSNAGSPPAGWAVALTADTTNGALDIQVTGAAATNIRWVAHIMLTEVAYP